jgi:hypothetical protein
MLCRTERAQSAALCHTRSSNNDDILELHLALCVLCSVSFNVVYLVQFRMLVIAVGFVLRCARVKQVIPHIARPLPYARHLLSSRLDAQRWLGE